MNERPKVGEKIRFMDHREGKIITARVYKTNETHLTVTYPDGKLGTMSWDDYESNKEKVK